MDYVGCSKLVTPSKTGCSRLVADCNGKADSGCCCVPHVIKAFMTPAPTNKMGSGHLVIMHVLGCKCVQHSVDGLHTRVLDVTGHDGCWCYSVHLHCLLLCCLRHYCAGPPNSNCNPQQGTQCCRRAAAAGFSVAHCPAFILDDMAEYL